MASVWFHCGPFCPLLCHPRLGLPWQHQCWCFPFMFSQRSLDLEFEHRSNENVALLHTWKVKVSKSNHSYCAACSTGFVFKSLKVSFAPNHSENQPKSTCVGEKNSSIVQWEGNIVTLNLFTSIFHSTNQTMELKAPGEEGLTQSLCHVMARQSSNKMWTLSVWVSSVIFLQVTQSMVLPEDLCVVLFRQSNCKLRVEVMGLNLVTTALLLTHSEYEVLEARLLLLQSPPLYWSVLGQWIINEETISLSFPPKSPAFTSPDLQEGNWSPPLSTSGVSGFDLAVPLPTQLILLFLFCSPYPPHHKAYWQMGSSLHF